MNRRASRYNHRDATEPAILAVLRQLKVEYWIGGPLDIWVWLDEFIPVEIKTKKGRLTWGQKEFISRCEMLDRPYFIWYSAEGAIKDVTEWRNGG